MKRSILALAIPPFAVCRYGCAGCCAAPIGVFWLAGIISIIYAFFGGPTGADGISVGTLGLGVILWVIATVWAENVIKGVTEDAKDKNCETKASTVCRLVQPKLDDSDPMEEVKKFHH